MADIITYPENGITYDADDASGYLATRLSGVYSAEEDFSVTAQGGLSVQVSAGQAWVRPARFKGRSIIMEQPTTLPLTAADAVRSRIDRVVLRYDAAAKKTSLQVLDGTPDSAAPAAPAITRTELIYDLCLAEIKRPAGSTSVTAADIYDTRADETVCGVMRDGVHGIPAATLIQMLRQKIAEMDSGSFYTKEAVDDMLAVIQAQVAKAGAPTERLAFVTQISANRWGWNETMSCEATIPKGVDFIRITPENFNSLYVLQFPADKDLSLTGKNKAIAVICASNADFKYTASDRKIKITAYNTDIGRTCIQGYKYGTAATPCIVWTEGDGTSAKAHDIDYIEIRERYNADSSDDKNTLEAVARVVKGSTYTTAGGATVTFASDGTVTASNYSGTLVGYRYMTLTEVSEQLASAQSALADADALNLDQDYRLTLLELGVTDDETTA
ncbi:hypothetical protein [Faecalibacterium prausnitzii]|uniref:hypothetical protein n=1 Tax=Faecalibacterium prausnitzii TaxID=853 RepID=UPI001CBF0C80|nr:hypothetical protein [Faecalibacterium prausnitzii]